MEPSIYEFRITYSDGDANQKTCIHQVEKIREYGLSYAWENIVANHLRNVVKDGMVLSCIELISIKQI